jgi:hypothetical protein
MLRPRSGWQQWVAREQYVLSPSVPAVEFTDLFGNLCQRLVAPAGHFSVHTSVDIETADASDTPLGPRLSKCNSCPMRHYRSLYPSRYCESDRFTEMASIARGGPGRRLRPMQCHRRLYPQHGTVHTWRRTADHQCLRAKQLEAAYAGTWPIWASLVAEHYRYQLEWSWATLRSLNRWIYTLGSRPMSEIVVHIRSNTSRSARRSCRNRFRSRRGRRCHIHTIRRSGGTEACRSTV